jgi:hypothetical protein
MAPQVSPLGFALQSMGLRSPNGAGQAPVISPSSIVAASPAEKKKIELFSAVRLKRGGGGSFVAGSRERELLSISHSVL